MGKSTTVLEAEVPEIPTNPFQGLRSRAGQERHLVEAETVATLNPY